jgi:hypothetical protein
MINYGFPTSTPDFAHPPCPFLVHLNVEKLRKRGNQIMVKDKQHLQVVQIHITIKLQKEHQRGLNTRYFDIVPLLASHFR